VLVGHNLLFRWFVGLAMDVTVFTKNRNRLLQAMSPAGSWSRNGERDFHGEKAQQPDPRLNHRSGRQVIQEVARLSSQAMSHGACGDGEPQRPGGGNGDDTGAGTAEREAAVAIVAVSGGHSSARDQTAVSSKLELIPCPVVALW
jgi:hypothetical protein